MALREFILITAFIFLQIALSSGLDCYSCDSINDSNCATFKSNMEETVCADSCAVWIDGIDTYRGCNSTIPEGITDYRSCESNKCNSIIYPENRIKCVKCSADEPFCANPDAGALYPCRNYVEDDSCYAYMIDETSAIRGCLSDEDSNVDTCNSFGETCIKCSEEFCNLGVSSYISCVSCSSEFDDSCGYTQEEAQKDLSKQKLCRVLLGRDTSCFAYRNETHFLRGCLDDYPELKISCAENTEDCHICSEDVCNSMKIVEELCYVCDSTTDEDCRNVASNVTPMLCGEGTINKSGCYLSDKDGTVQRGCVTLLSDREIDECQNGSDSCKICDGSMCNIKQSFQKCYTCDSHDDMNCATLQSGDLPEKTCNDYLDTCKVYVVPNMTTHRGCFNEMLSDNVECSPQSVNCKQCPENNCNGEVFPSNRLLCHHCESSSSDSECFKSLEDDTTEFSYPCATYNFRDSCYFNITENGNTKVVHRGCLSDIGTEKCLGDQTTCKTCQTSNCNSESIMKSPAISCITCDTAGEIECNWGWKESLAMKCKKDYFFYEDETCYTMSFSDQVIRGCTLDGNICRNSPYCELCDDEDACNRFNVAEQYCYECSSDIDRNCGPQPFHTSNITCPGVFDYEHRGCFTWDLGNSHITRGCYSDLTVDQKLNCTRDDEHCVFCKDKQNCNDKQTDSAFMSNFNVALISCMLLVLMSFV